MSTQNSPSDDANNNTTSNESASVSSPPRQSHNPFLSPTSSNNQFLPTDFSYPSIFPPNTESLSISPSDGSFDEFYNTISTQNRLNQASFILENEQLYDSYALCLATLQESIKEIDALRGENESLRFANADLIHRLGLLSESASLSFIDDFSSTFSIGGITSVRDGPVTKAVPSVSPTSVIEQNRLDNRNDEQFSLPKSISVRSSGYLKTNQRGGAGNRNRGSLTQSTRQQRVARTSLKEPQRVYVPGGKSEEASALEFEVYNQGMQKTELCNKWQESGTCPYGGGCQFAHGIGELRPVIRHPRYKTQVCRMVLSGVMCPYGHRCHFRHSLTDQEKLQGHY